MPNLPRGNATLLQNGLASSGFLRVSDHTALDIHACPFRACENTLGQKLENGTIHRKHLLLSGLTLCIVLHSWTMRRESIATLQHEIAELLTIPILGHISTFVDHVIVEFVPKNLLGCSYVRYASA